jgi:hypothetical protein
MTGGKRHHFAVDDGAGFDNDALVPAVESVAARLVGRCFPAPLPTERSSRFASAHDST